MSAEDKFENTTDKVGGKIQEGAGKLTGDKETEARGKTQADKADLKNKIENVKDTVKGAVDGLLGNDKK